MSEVPIETGVDDIHSAPARTGRHWFDIILAVTAIFISSVSLYVAIEHGRTERDLVAANSWPFLRMLLSDRYDGEDQIAIGATNAGTGPAKIRSFEMALDGHWISSPVDLLHRCCGVPLDKKGYSSAIPAGTLSMSSIDNSVLRPAEDNPVLIFHRRAENARTADLLDKAFDRMTFRVCYCSALNECWKGDLRTLDTQPAKLCGNPQHPYRFTDR